MGRTSRADTWRWNYSRNLATVDCPPRTITPGIRGFPSDILRTNKHKHRNFFLGRSHPISVCVPVLIRADYRRFQGRHRHSPRRAVAACCCCCVCVCCTGAGRSVFRYSSWRTARPMMREGAWASVVGDSDTGVQLAAGDGGRWRRCLCLPSVYGRGYLYEQAR